MGRRPEKTDRAVVAVGAERHQRDVAAGAVPVQADPFPIDAALGDEVLTGKKFEVNLPENRFEFQFYADHGYTVRNVDYKASRGYGRESRTAVFLKMGAPEIESLEAAVAVHVDDRLVQQTSMIVQA